MKYKVLTMGLTDNLLAVLQMRLNQCIKNNLNLIIAGKSQPVLSQILLGNNDAWDKIPSDERGLFLTDEGTLFRGFLLPPELIAPDNYKPRPRADQDTTNDEEGGNQ